MTRKENKTERLDNLVFITPRTLRFIRKAREERESFLKAVVSELGDAGSDTDRWHSEIFRIIQDDVAVKRAILKLTELPQDAKLVLIQPNESEKIGLGSSVVLEFSPGEEEVYTLVSSIDVGMRSRPLNWISAESPVGKAILDKKVGDEVEIETPGGRFMVKIKGVSPAKDLDDEKGMG